MAIPRDDAASAPVRGTGLPQDPADPVSFVQTLDDAFGPQAFIEDDGRDADPEPLYSNLLSEPKDRSLGPTAFQQKKVNWSDGGENPNAPKAFRNVPVDFLEADYEYGLKEGASDKPVLAANVFGRQFTRQELEHDDEGRRLLDLMQSRRRGDYNEGGALANFAKGFSAWSASDIPYYGWVSDIGVSAGEAIDISKTMRKLQDGERVTPHEVIRARRYMMQQELESTRTAAYQVGSVARQAIPFMAEMFVDSMIVAGIAGAATGGIGAIPGAIAGAAIAPAKFLWRMFTKGAPKALAKVTDREIAKYAVKGAIESADDIAKVTRKGMEVYGSNRAFRQKVGMMMSRAAEELGEGATRRQIRNEAIRMTADAMSRRAPEELSAKMAARMLYGSDYRIKAETAITRGLEDLCLSKGGIKASEFATLSPKQRSGVIAKVWQGLRKEEKDQFAKSVLAGLKTENGKIVSGLERFSSDIVRSGMEDTTGLLVSKKYADSVARHVLDRTFGSFDLKYGDRAFSGIRRFNNWLGEHVTRGFVQSEHAYFAGGLPTIGHAGFSSFNTASDALKEGLGRVFVEAPIQGAMQAAVGPLALAPIFAVASGHNAGDAVFKGQLGFQANALMTGDRKNMDTARQCAIGSLFVEYMSESAGRGLGLMAGGALTSNPLARKAFGAKTGAADAIAGGLGNVWDDFMSKPLTRRAGDMLSRAVDAVYGVGRKGRDNLAAMATKYVRSLAEKKGAQFAEAEVASAIRTRSLDKVGDGLRSLLSANGIRTIRQLENRVAFDAAKGDTLKAIVNVIGLKLMNRGLTPDEIVRKFRQMGKGGIIEEMGEERLGDFVRGALHLDDTASDADIDEHLKSMFSGFTDPKQLMVEFLGFAFPGIARSTAMGMQKWVMRGELAEAREESGRIASVLGTVGNARPGVSFYIDERDAEAKNRRDAKGAEMLAGSLGRTEENRAAFSGNAAAIASGNREETMRRIVEGGGLEETEFDRKDPTRINGYRASVDAVLGAGSEAETVAELETLADSYMRYDSEKDLENALKQTGAEVLFGTDGVNAIRREWRKIGGHEFASDNPIEQSLAQYKSFMAEPISRTRTEKPMTFDELGRQVRTFSPLLAPDSSPVAKQRADLTGKEALSPVVDEGVRDQFAEDVMNLTRRIARASFFSDDTKNWGRRAVSKVIGLIGAATTGDVSLAFRNPVAWLARDAGLPQGILQAGLGFYAAAFAEGFRAYRTGETGIETKVSEELSRLIDEDPAKFSTRLAELRRDGTIPSMTFDRIEELGRPYYEKKMQQLADMAIAGSGIIMVTRGQSDQVIMDYVASHHRTEDGMYALRDGTKVSDPEDARFRDSWAPEIDRTRSELVDSLIRLAADEQAFRYSTGAVLGTTTPRFAVDVVRAIKNGTSAEMMGAILALPAFRDVAKTVNVSGLTEHDREIVLSAMNARSVDVGEIASVDTSKDLDGADERKVAFAMRLDLSDPSVTRDEAQRAMKAFVARCRLLREGGMTTFEDLDGQGREARVVPDHSGPVKSFAAVIRDRNGNELLNQTFGSFADARDAILSYAGTRTMTENWEGGNDFGFSERTKTLVVSTLSEIVSSDATSLVFFRYDSNRERLRFEYLRQAAGLRAAQDDMLPDDVKEKSLPPYLRKNEDRSGWLFEGPDAAANAAKAFRDELASGAAKAYEETGDRILSGLGINRVTGLESSSILGIGGSYVCHLNSMTLGNGDTMVISPDYATTGDSEGMLRYGLRQAIDTWRGNSVADTNDRNCLLAYAYRRFEACAETVADRLERKDSRKAKRLRDEMRKVLYRDSNGISTASIAAIASSSGFFSCDRGLMQSGNGFFGSPELAAVADEFRREEVYPFFLSAIDEALGGTGFFHAGEGTTSGLSAWVDAFGRNGRELADARKSTVFGDGKSAANPYLVRLALRAGIRTRDELEHRPMAVVTAADASVDENGRVRAFGGDNVLWDYLGAVSKSCSQFTRDYANVAGEGNDFRMSTAEAYRLAIRSGLCGGASSSDTGVRARLRGGSIREGAKAEARNVEIKGQPFAMTVEAAMNTGAALRRIAMASGMRDAKAMATFGDYLRNRNVPENVVDAVGRAYTGLYLAEDRRPGTKRKLTDDIGAILAAEGETTVENHDEQRRLSGLMDNDDTQALSDVLRWFFQWEGGSVSATLSVVRDGLTAGTLLGDEAVAKAVEGLPDGDRVAESVRDLVAALSVGSDKATFGENNAKSLLWCGDDARITRALDDAIRVLAASGHYDYAAALAVIRDVPTADGRRNQFLQTLAQHTAVEPMKLERNGDFSFGLDFLGTLAESSRTPNAVVQTYASLLGVDADVGPDSRIDLTGTTAKSLADGIAEAISAVTYDRKATIGEKPTRWDALNAIIAKNRVDLESMPAFSPIGSKTSFGVAVDAADLAVIQNAANGEYDREEVRKALDNIQALVWNRMRNMAEAVDLVFGPGSPHASMLRSRDTLAYIRRRAESALGRQWNEASARFRVRESLALFGDEDVPEEALARDRQRFDRFRAAGVNSLLSLANYFAVGNSENRNYGEWSVYHSSAYLSDLVQEPLVQLARRLGAGDLLSTNGFVLTKNVPALKERLEKALSERLANEGKPVGGKRRAVRAIVREELKDIGLMKAATGLEVAKGLTPAEMDAKRNQKGEEFDATRIRDVQNLTTAIDAYVSSLPQSSRSLAGHERNMADVARNKSLMTLPSDLPADIRMQAHELFADVKVGGKSLTETLAENGGRWADGSRLLVSVVGAKDIDGTLVPKEYLAGILDRTIRDEFANGNPSHVLLPFFRADKPSCYAIRMPVDVATEWVKQVAGNEKIMESLKPELRKLVETEDPDRDSLYRAVFGLAMTAAGQADIDPKRVATTLSVGSFIPMYRPEGEDDKDAACYFVSVLGARTGASLTGGYLIGGVGSENVRSVSARVNGHEEEAEKLHITSPKGVFFKKGQANDYGWGFGDEDWTTTQSSILYYQAQGRRTLESVLGLPANILDPVEEPKDADPAKVTEWKLAKKAPHDDAVAKARAFLRRSTLVVDDLETNKAGIFGSSCGFAWDGESDFRLSFTTEKKNEVTGKTKTTETGIVCRKTGDGYVTTDLDGKPLAGNWNVQPDAKKGQMPILWALSALCMAKRDGKLTNAEINSISAVFRLQNGTDTPTPVSLKDTGLLADGDGFDVRNDGTGNAVVTFRTRNAHAQIVAQNANSAIPEYDHVFATNATRDMEILEELANAENGTGHRDFVSAHAGYTVLQLAMLQNNPTENGSEGRYGFTFVSEACGEDPDLVAAYAAHPNDPEVRDKVAKKIGAFLRRQALIGFYGTHGVMCPSAGNGHTPVTENRGSHTVKIEWLPGTTQYDKDIYRPARVYGTEEAEFYGKSRDFGSGCVNVRAEGFRYGLYLDEDAFGKFCSSEFFTANRHVNVPEEDVDTAKWAEIEQCSAEEAEKAANLVRAIRIAMVDADARNALLGCFTDYSGRKASESAGSKGARFDDLFREDGTFDYAAVGIGRSRRNAVSERDSTVGSVYLAGSPFCAHRSPSGNIEAFQGTVRATAPMTFNAKAGAIGSEAKYALDPVTMMLQGSDTDGDSAGLQFYDYGAGDDVSPDDIRSFASAWAGKPADQVMEYARKKGWTEQEEFYYDGSVRKREIIRESVIRQFTRAAFVAQIRNYENAATFHQGQVGAYGTPAKSAKHSADGVWSGAEFVDHYRRNNPGLIMTRELDNEFVCDYGWAGRQPVGTDAVWDEPVAGADLSGLSARARKIMEKAKVGSDATFDRLLEAFVDAAGHGEKTDALLDPEKSAMLSDAAADSAKARGVSVFHQSRFLRAFVREVVENYVVPLVRRDGYAPLVDLVSHFDGISNNLFDTLKKMFATRAGWTQQMLPFMLGRTVIDAANRLKDGTSQLGNAFFFTECANFLADLAHPTSTLARIERYTDPANGRKAIVEAAKEAGLRVTNRMSVTDVAELYCRSRNIRIAMPGRKEPSFPTGKYAIIYCANRMENETKGVDVKSAAAQRTEQELALVQRVLDRVRDFGERVDYMVGAGKDELGQRGLQNRLDITDTDSVDNLQQKVVDSYASAVRGMSDSYDTLASDAKDMDKEILEKMVSKEQKKEFFENRRKNGIAEGVEIDENHQRLSHLIGALDAADRTLVTKFGKTTVEFVENFADAVRYLSNSAWKNYDGRSGRKIGNLLRSVVAKDGKIDLLARTDETALLRLREGFDAMRSSDAVRTLRWKTGDTEHTVRMSDADIAKLLVVHASATRPFGAAENYIGQSNLPAVFGDAYLRDLEETASRKAKVSGHGVFAPVYLDLVRIPPVRVGSFKAFDFMSSRAKAMLSELRAIEGERSEKLVYGDITRAKSAKHVGVGTLMGERGESFDVSDSGADVVAVNPAFGTPLATVTDFRDGTYAPVSAFRDAGGQFAFSSVEAAYNASLAIDEVEKCSGDDGEANRRYFESYYRANGNRPAADNPDTVRRRLRNIIADAASRDFGLYSLIRNAGVRFITHPNPSMQAAFNDVANMIDDGRIEEPQQGVRARMASTLGGNSEASDATRADFLDRVSLTGWQGATGEQMTRTIPEAIAEGFRAAFGSGVEVTTVNNDRGEPTNLLKVVRKAKGKSVVTYVSYGDTPRMDGMSRSDKIASLLDMLNGVRSAKGYAPLSVRDLESLSGGDIDMMLDSMKLAGLQVGESRTATSLGFAPVMSGVIRLSADAGFDTMFHEYFHQMLACYKRMGVYGASEMRELQAWFHGEDGRFDEEAAADAYARFLTGSSGAWDDVKLRDYVAPSSVSAEDRERFSKVLTLFDRFREIAKGYANALRKGYADDGKTPVFVYATMVYGDFTESQLAKLTEPTPEQTAQMEAYLLNQRGQFALTTGRSAEQLVRMSDGVQRMLSELQSENPSADAVREAMSEVAAVADENAPEAPAADISAPIAESYETVAGKTSAFLRAALTRFRRDGETPAMRAALDRYSLESVNGTGNASEVVYAARRLLREVAALEGYETEDADGNLNETGRRLLSDHNVAELALRLIANTEAERSDGSRPEDALEVRARHAGADYTFARALEHVAPNAYFRFCTEQAKKAETRFYASAVSMDAKAEALERSEAAEDRRLAESYRTQARELRGLAMRVVPLARKIAAGLDLHDEFPGNPNRGNLHGLAFATFSGGARFGEKHAFADGISRYDPKGGSAYGFDLSDPAITAAFDFASMAFFVAEAARKYNGIMGLTGKDRVIEGTGDLLDAPAETPAEEPVAPEIAEGGADERGAEIRREAYAEDDFGPYEMADAVDTTPEWILANPGTWLLSDLQGDLMGADMRGMLTDHTAQAACEEGFAFADTFHQVYGLDTWVGDAVREMKRRVSDLGTNEEGDFAHVDGRRATTVFSNTRGALLGMIAWGEKRVGRPFDRNDIRMVHWIGETIKILSARGRFQYTGAEVHALDSKHDIERLSGDDWETLYSPAAVIARHVASDAEKRENPMTALDLMLYNLLTHHVEEVLGVSETTNHLGNANGYYRTVVSALRKGVETANGLSEARDEPPDYQGEMLRQLLNARENASGETLARRSSTGRTVLVIPVMRSVNAWNDCAARTKLLEAGRTEELLNPFYWAGLFAKQFNNINRAAAASRFMNVGAGSNVSLAGSSTYWFHTGTGAHAIDVSKYQNALKALEDTETSTEEQLRAREETLFGILESVRPEILNATAFLPDGSSRVSDRAVKYLANLMGVVGRDDSSFDVRAFAARVADGAYENSDYGVSIPADAKVADVYMAINRLTETECIDNLSKGKDLPAAVRREYADRLKAAGLLADALRRELPGTVVASTEDEEFMRNGRLGNAGTAGEELVRMCREFVTAERFRGGLAQMLVSVGSDGTPNFIVNPTDAIVEQSGMPDEYWGALARFVISRMSLRSRMPQYDAGMSGVENMRNVYDFVTEHRRDFAMHDMDVVKMNADRMFRGILCTDSRTDNAGNVNTLTHLQNGEADAYMRQLFAVFKAPSVDSVVSKLDRVMSWTKIASVGFSAFFNVATVFESATAATGFWHTVMGMSKTGSRTARAIGRALGRKGGTGAFTSDAVFMSDIAEYLNSDDPFVRRGRELCDLINMPLDRTFRFVGGRDDSNPGMRQGGIVKGDIERVTRWATLAGWKPGTVKRMRKTLQFLYEAPTDYTFNVVLNAVKMSVVLQTMRRLREECVRGNRPFDPIRELAKYADYINAEIGGIDPGKYAWATPEMRKILSLSMFSWQWTVGAWVAGGGEAVTDAIFGGHSSTPTVRARSFVRWLRMLGIVKFGVPVVLQAAIKALSKALAAGLPPDDEAKELKEEIDRMPWFCPLNESKVGSLNFDVTPLLKLAARVPGVRAAKEAKVPVVSALIPAYVGGGRNTTGKRRYYMHFGKQSDEFFRWFEDPVSQLIAKSSIPAQKVLEGLFGQVNPSGYRKAFADKGLLERFFNTNFSMDENALVNLLSAGTSFSSQSVASNPDAGFLSAVGPMKMGESKRSTRLRIVERLNGFMENDNRNNPWSYSRNRRRLNQLCTDIFREAQLNGVPPDRILASALGDVTKVQYGKLMAALPKDPTESASIDGRRALEALRALTRVNKKFRDIRSSVLQKYENAGVDLRKSPMMRRALLDLIRAVQSNPLRTNPELTEEAFERYFRYDDLLRRSTQMDAKGGENFGNFLATDEVPDTLFGVPVVTDGYTAEDLAFFREHPEAGGFYDLGDGTATPRGPATPRDPEPPATDGPAVRGASKGGEASDEYVARVNAAVREVIPFLKEHEGFRADAYEDTQGKPTIGYGQRTIGKRDVTMDDRGMAEADAAAWLERRVKDNAYALLKRHAWMEKLSPGALAAAYDLAYNLGDGIFTEAKSPTFNRRLAEGEDPEEVFWSELPTYTGGKDATEKTKRGLANRRSDAKAKWRKRNNDTSQIENKDPIRIPGM